ncbi:MAG: hypothetical protein WDO74_37400 [Pseudomonadota bacterium]
MLNANKVLLPHEVAWERAITSHTNVLYYQAQVAFWTRLDTSIRFVSAIAATGAAALFLKDHSTCGAIVSSVTALGNVIGLTLRVPDKVRALGVLLAEYVGHANTFENIHQFGATDDELRHALAAFGETEQREAKDHPHPRAKLLAQCQAAVEKRVGAAPHSAIVAA